MLHDNTKRERPEVAPFFILAFFLGNLLFLGRFPFVHSDESWLAGLTLEMIQAGNLAVTEPFFNLFPRHPHAIKILFHILQMPFLSLGGYNHVAVRLVSLVFGSLSLYLLYLVLRPRFKKGIALTGTVLMALNIQLIYASHFARQEAVILCCLMSSLYLGLRAGREDRPPRRDVLLQGLVIGIAVGVHPNSFIIFVANLLLLVYRIAGKDLPPRMMMHFLLPVAAGGILFVAISFLFDPGFLDHYLSYGNTVGVSFDPTDRFTGLFRFYGKLFYSVSGTYYVPRQKLLWILYAVFFGAGIIRLLIPRWRKVPLLAETLIILAGINLGYLAVGKYSQPSIVFIFPFLIILCVSVFYNAGRLIRTLVMVGAGILFMINAILNIQPMLDSDYRGYLGELRKTLPEEGAVLVNLNAAFLFQDRPFYDYRNLAFLEEAGMSFEDYVDTYGIGAIVVPEELDYIYNHRPRWNIIYGNIVPWYREMQEFLRNRCTLTGQFDSPWYGMRITRYIGTQPWKVRVYRVVESE
jgi:4-amino-4-deoxy-L-arabinose transferase-like glycosyltransferase